MRTILKLNGDMPRYDIACLTALAILLLACESGPGGDREATDAAPATTGADSASLNGLIAGTPPGDLEQWVADMRTGLDSVKAAVSSNRSESHRRLLELYVTRQEYLEMYYGPSGRMEPEPVLSTAVKVNETRFHELMRLTGATPPAQEAAIDAALSALDKQLTQVLENAGRTAKRVRSSDRPMPRLQ